VTSDGDHALVAQRAGESGTRLRVMFLAQRTCFPAGKIPPSGSGAHVAATLAGLHDHFDVLPLLAEDFGPASGTRIGRFRRLVPRRIRGARRDIGFVLQDRHFGERALAAAAEFRPHVVYERSEYFAATGSRLAKRLGVPLVLEVNGLLDLDVRPQYRSLAEPFGAANERRKHRAASTIVVEGPGMARALEHRGVASEKLVIVPNSVPLWKVARKPRPARSGPPVIGWIGHLMPWYRESLEFLLQVAPVVAREVPGVRFEIVAGGPGLDDLRARAGAVGLGGSFRFRGAVAYELVPSVLAEFDVGVIPTAFDYQFPTKLVEMGAAGLPVIAPRTSSIDGLLVGGSEYEPFIPGDAADFADAMIRVASDPDRRERLGRAMHSAVAERLTWPIVGEAIAAAVRGSVG
jgi:glycosyltransferase involved in cell wall biosynthesis